MFSGGVCLFRSFYEAGQLRLELDLGRSRQCSTMPRQVIWSHSCRPESPVCYNSIERADRLWPLPFRTGETRHDRATIGPAICRARFESDMTPWNGNDGAVRGISLWSQR